MNNSFWMKRVLHIANQALNINKIPIAAIIIKDNFELGLGLNFTASNYRKIYHAEINSLRQAIFYYSNNILQDAEIYITLEPCINCIFHIHSCGIKLITFSAYSNLNRIIYSHNFKKVKGGFMEQTSKHLLSKFFSNNRH